MALLAEADRRDDGEGGEKENHQPDIGDAERQPGRGETARRRAHSGSTTAEEAGQERNTRSPRAKGGPASRAVFGRLTRSSAPDFSSTR